MELVAALEPEEKESEVKEIGTTKEILWNQHKIEIDTSLPDSKTNPSK